MPTAELLLLKNSIQTYAWGSTTEIPRLLGVPETGGPQAEVWMGTHPKAPSEAWVAGEWRDLRDVITRSPREMLGEDVVQRFGTELPFLLKVLAVADPLSLQAHPSADQARKGFDRENAAGIPLDAPHRNYRDAYPKPELITALTSFRALCGFRPFDEIFALFSALELTGHLAAFSKTHPSNAEAIESLFRELLNLDRYHAQPLIDRTAQACRVSAPLDYLASCATFLELERKYPGDPGALTSLMLNCVELAPGEAIFLPAGNLHAYLGGLGVEIMASSDNVLRGGLTPKHVDQRELLDTLTFEGGHVKTLPGPAQRARESLYVTEAEQFSLLRVDLRGAVWSSDPIIGPSIVFVAEGPVEIGGANLPRLEQGQSIFVPASAAPYTVSGYGTLFVASVPPKRPAA